MKTIAEIRRDNLALLTDEFGSQDKVAELAETSSVYLSQIRNEAPDAKTGKPRQMGDPMARKIEAGCSKERGWMDHPHDVELQRLKSNKTITYATSADDPTIRTMLAAETKAPTTIEQKYDSYTLEAISIMMNLKEHQREGALAALRTHIGNLGPPSDGQTLSMAA